MKRIFSGLVLAWLLVTVSVSSTLAVSEATALFLRIAPGARAAAMGEAFVAVADDATTTHWNPAGLGAYPLSDSWNEARVPAAYRPITAFAALKRGKGTDYQAYELWVLSANGLVRYDNRQWYTGEVFSTRTDQTVTDVVSSFFREEDEERLKAMIEKVAEVNNRRSRPYLNELRDSVMQHVPEDYRSMDALTAGFDSLIAVYSQCRIDWNKVTEAEDLFIKGMKDSTLTDTEIDRLSFAVEKAKTRFIMEELLVPYSVLYNGELTSITSDGKTLVVGTTDGLLTFNGKRWRRLTDEDDLPAGEITALLATPWTFYVGTDSGLCQFTGSAITSAPAAENLPRAPVTAIGAVGGTNVCVIVDNDFYRFDGSFWSNSFDYTVVIDDSPEKIADKFAIYGTDSDKDAFLQKFRAMNESYTGEVGAADQPDTNTTEEMPDATASATGEEVDTTEESAEAASLDNLIPGSVVQVPYTTGFKGEVTAVLPEFGDRVWIGTEYGVLLFNGSGWYLPGYNTHVVGENETLDSLVAGRSFQDSTARAEYRQLVVEINELTGRTPATGEEVYLPRNAAASRINMLNRSGSRIYMATAQGMRSFDGKSFSRVSEKGMDRVNAIHVEVLEDELWLAADDQIVTKANGGHRISFMHVNWLPALADDLYYEFLSYVHSVEGWGTLGGNITFLSYGSIALTDEVGNPRGTDEPFEIAFTLSYGTSLTSKLKGGVSAKFIYSRLADRELAGTIGAVAPGTGVATSLAVDLGVLYYISQRLNFGAAITNLGPDLQYSQQSQADPLPRNLAFGLAYKLIQSDNYRLLVTAEANRLLVEGRAADTEDPNILDDIGTIKEFKEMIFNGGGEFVYGDIIALRGGYIYDQEGKIKTATFGVGLTLLDRLKFDFSYIPGDDAKVILANTLRVSLEVLL